MNDLTFNLLKIVVSICSALIAAYLVPFIKAKLHEAKYSDLLMMVEIAVRAAEQTIGAGKGSTKKDEVMTFVMEWMHKAGIAISVEQLDQLIEAAVFNMNNEK